MTVSSGAIRGRHGKASMEGLAAWPWAVLATMICLQREPDPVARGGPDDGLGRRISDAVPRDVAWFKARGFRKACAPGANRHRATSV
jgi:hypothetical protein